MLKKNSTTMVVGTKDSMCLPSDNNELEKFIVSNKVDLTEHALSSIEHAIENNLSAIEIFHFSNTDFVITINACDYKSNIDHILKFYLNSERYELCPRAVKLQKLLQIPNSYNEKKQKTFTGAQ